MTREENLALLVCGRHEKLMSNRMPHETDWNEIRDLVRPIYMGYNALTGQHYVAKTTVMYDGTAPDALEDLAGGLHSYMTNPTERWFELEVEGDATVNRDPEALAWLEEVSDMIYAQYNVEEANLNPTLHEVYLDVASFGTGVIYQEWSRKMGLPVFRSFPVDTVYIAENSEGKVDTLFRCINWTLRQVKQEFGDLLPKKMMEFKDEEKPIKLVHAVFPRTDRDASKFDGKNKKFVSAWVSVTTKELIEEGGYDTFPYHAGRWTKLAGEVYGRSPAKKCLPDIKMLNVMERTILKAANKMVDPPLMIPDDGYIIPVDTTAGGLIYKEPGAPLIEALRFEGNLPWAEDKANQKREFIRKCFYSEWLKMEKLNKEMTAYEVADRREEKLRMISPMLGRLSTELHGPMIARTYRLLLDHDKLPQSPAILNGKKLKVGYLSPASRAQTGTKAIAMGRYITELTPVAQVDPTVLDVIDMDKYATELALARGTPRTILRSPEEIAQIRQARAQQQQMAAMAAAAEPVSKAMKNLADASQAGGIV